MNIGQGAMCYILIDLYQHALQTYESFFQISESFFKLTTIFQNNSDVGFVHARRGRRYLC